MATPKIIKVSTEAQRALINSGIPTQYHAVIIEWVERANLAKGDEYGWIYRTIENDLRDALFKNTQEEMHHTQSLIKWFEAHAPDNCYGSIGSYDWWQMSYRHFLQRLEEEEKEEA